MLTLPVDGSSRRLTLEELRASQLSSRDDLEYDDSSVPAKVAAPVPPKVSTHGYLDREELERIALAALEADKAKGRKALAFPQLRSFYAKERRNSEGDVIRKARSYYGDVWAYSQRVAFRLMLDLQRRNLPLPTVEQLRELIQEQILESGETWHPYDGQGPGLSVATVDHLAEQAALAALRDFDSDYLQRRSELGKRAAGIPKPPRRSWTAGDLAVLWVLGDLPAIEQLTILNEGKKKPISRSAFYRMKQVLQEQDSN